MVLKMGIRSRFFILRLIVFLLIVGSFASAWAAEGESALSQSIRREVEQKYLEEAVSAFNAHDYGRAKIAFGMLCESAQSPEIARQALFGLASVKLILARTPDEYQDALSFWQKWSALANTGTVCEDPRFLTPFLLRLDPALKNSAESRPVKPAPKSSKDVDNRGALQTKEKEMASLRSKLELREREIRRLRHQMESLEEIHRKYQEKKQEATP